MRALSPLRTASPAPRRGATRRRTCTSLDSAPWAAAFIPVLTLWAAGADPGNFALSHLASYAETLRVYVKSGLISLISRMTRLGWFGDSQHREISSEVAKFMQARPTSTFTPHAAAVAFRP